MSRRAIVEQIRVTCNATAPLCVRLHVVNEFKSNLQALSSTTAPRSHIGIQELLESLSLSSRMMA